MNQFQSKKRKRTSRANLKHPPCAGSRLGRSRSTGVRRRKWPRRSSPFSISIILSRVRVSSLAWSPSWEGGGGVPRTHGSDRSADVQSDGGLPISYFAPAGMQAAEQVSALRVAVAQEEARRDRTRHDIAGTWGPPAIAPAVVGAIVANLPLVTRFALTRGCFAWFRNLRNARRRRSCSYTRDASSGISPLSDGFGKTS